MNIRVSNQEPGNKPDDKMLNEGVKGYQLKKLSVFLLLAVLFFGWGTPLHADESEPGESEMAEPVEEVLPTDDLAAGKVLYEKLCISCHGVEGDGDGPAADFFEPKPRSFKKAEYKYRTTPKGALPTDDDLFRAIARGLPGTGMPDWADKLNKKKINQVIKYIKTFSDKWDNQQGPHDVIPVGEPVASSEESIEKGKKQFTALGCTLCHGAEGRGDGATASVLTDHRGDPVYPRNLSKNWLFRGGGETKDIYMRINTGLNGTPMPSFADQLDNEQSWDLANYVRSLSPAVQPERGSMIKSGRVDGDVPSDPEDPLWQEAEVSWFPMMGQITFEERLFTLSVTDITVKSLYNDKEIGFLLIWDDRSKSKKKAPPKPTFTDQVAIQFPEKLQPGGVVKPYFIMGDEKLGVNLWTWRAEENQFLESNANGIHAEEQFQPVSDVRGKGSYVNGQYRVVMKRALNTGDTEKDIQFESGVFYPIAFHAWDGGNGETLTKRSVTPWYFVLMTPETPKSVYIFPPVVVIIVFGLEFLLQKMLRKNRDSSA